jgi:TPR repeat protein
MTSLRNQMLCGLLILTQTGCASRRSAPVDSTAILTSIDRVAVYDAGVDAFRAKRYDLARRYWKRAIELGDRDASSNLGYLLYYGFGGAPDSAAGRHYWQQAMAQRQPESHRHVAQAIVDGDRTLGDLSDAFSHAVAAKGLANAAGTRDAAVARDADALISKLQPQLSPAVEDSARARGERWTRSYPAP